MPTGSGATVDATTVESVLEPGAARPGLIDRRSLVAALDRASANRVTILAAPAGSGKTSLLRTWAEGHRGDRLIAFMSVKPAQHDAQLFWIALLSEVRAVSGGSKPLPASPGFNGQAMVEKVISELAALGEPIVLVIDDLHELSSAEASDQLATLLTGLPRNVHTILASRRDPTLRLHQMRLAGELSEFRGAQLRFTEDETRQLLAAAGIRLPDADVASLHQRTEGWAAGIRLAALALTDHPQAERFVADFSGSDRTVAEYLMAEMLDRLSAEVQRMLLRTSLLDRVNGELADLLTGATDWENALLDLEDANAFVVALDPERTWFRYHRMFSDLLRLELRRTAPQDVPLLHRTAARWFADQGDAADAIRHLQAAGDWTQAAQLLTDHALSLTLDGKAGTAAALLKTFPRRIENDAPGLALVHAIADLDELQLEQAEAHLDVVRGYVASTPPDRQHRLRMAIASLDLLLARLRGHLEGVFEQVEALPRPAAGRSNADVALWSDLRAVALLNLGVTEAWSLRLAESQRHLKEGAALAHEIGRPYVEVACRAHLGFATSGESFAAAKQHCVDAIALATRSGWANEPVIAPALATVAELLLWTGEFEEGAQWLDRAKGAAPSAGEPGLQLLIHLISAIVPATRGRHLEALAELNAAGNVQSRMLGNHALTSRVVAWTIATQARLGNLDQARADLGAADDRIAATGEVRNAAAVVRLAEEDPAGARRQLEPVLDGSSVVLPHLTVVEAYLLDALACRGLGDERAAWASLERALHLAEPDRLILPFAMTGAWELLAALPPHETSHATLVGDILDAVAGGVLGSATTPEPADALSPSELRVLRYLPTNLTRPEIAAELSVSPNTINTHIRRIYAKLGATDRSSAVDRGRQLRLLSPGRGPA